MHRKFYRPQAGTVIATIALTMSATGGAVAATQLAANSVGTRQIRNHAIQLSDLSPAAIAELRGAAGPAGATGPQGPAGATGPTGHLTTDNITQREATGPVVTTAGQDRFLAVECGIDERVLGGGGYFISNPTTAGATPPSLMLSAPTAKQHQWDVGFTTTTAGGRGHAYAVCLKP